MKKALLKQEIPSKAAVTVVAFIILALGGSFISSKNKHTPEKVVPSPSAIHYYKFPQPSIDISTWNTYTDPILKFSIKYPSNVMIDPMDNFPGQRFSFIFTDLDWKNLGRNADYYESIHIYSQGSTGKDAFDAYINSGCGKPCNAIREFADWVAINNAYGIQYLGEYGSTYYITDEKKSGDVIFLSINRANGLDKQKLDILNQMIRTIRFER
jgi:hypothetical protein